MELFNPPLFWFCHFVCLLIVAADGSLRGRNDLPNWISEDLPPPPRSRGRELNIIGPDNRTFFTNAEDIPWSAVGQVFTETTRCTGVMVGPYLMLTALSCISRNADDNTMGWLRFVPAFFRGGSIYGAADAVLVSYFDMGTPDLDGMTAKQAAFNFAVVELNAPIGNTTVVKYWQAGVYQSGYNDDEIWDHIGYAHDVQSGMYPFSVDSISIDSFDSHWSDSLTKEAYLMNTSSLDVGSSWQIGGPVVGYFTNIDHPLIIGILSSTASAGFNLVCGGPVMVEKISERLLMTGN
jgi:V8-like Glu-specific endopeptidase